MSPRSTTRLRRGGSIALGLAVAASGVSAGPCDIYAEGGTPCVAAHATTRALYKDYNGPLYKVRRDYDGKTVDVYPLEAGGVANAATQDELCKDTTCLITTIYDQSGGNNDLTQAPTGTAQPGLEDGKKDSLSSAVGAPVKVNGQTAYGVFISMHHGYRNNQPNGTATGDDPEGMYAVLAGNHYNGNCCFNYGNAETDNSDAGPATMEAIYFGSGLNPLKGAGNGPWVGADLEDGLWGGGDETQDRNEDNPSIESRFVTSIIKGDSGNHWAIRGADSQNGDVSTYWDGKRPKGYGTMKKQGAIILGIGGDNSIRAQGTFYEGAMTASYPSDETESKVQQDIVNAKYEDGVPLSTGPKLTKDSKISLRATSECCTDRFITHVDGDVIRNKPVDNNSDENLKKSATWTVRESIARSDCFSFESVAQPGKFLRVRNQADTRKAYPQRYEIHVDSKELAGAPRYYGEEATFCTLPGFTDNDNISLRSFTVPTRYIRHFNGAVHAGRNGGFKDFDSPFDYHEDATWKVGAGFV